MNLNQVTIPSTDINRSIDFYVALGLELIVHTHDGYARFLCPDGGATLSVHKVEEVPQGSRTILYFEREDVDAYVQTLEDKGFEFLSKPENQSWLWRESRLEDPDGNPIIIYHAGENRVNPPWRKSR